MARLVRAEVIADAEVAIVHVMNRTLRRCEDGPAGNVDGPRLVREPLNSVRPLARRLRQVSCVCVSEDLSLVICHSSFFI